MYIKWIRRGLVMLLVVVSSVTVYLVVDTVTARADNDGAARNPANYALVQNHFEYSSSPYVLTLQFKGKPINTNTVEWRVLSSPAGVTSANIIRADGQNEFSFSGLAPQTSYTFIIVATVMQANNPVASVQLTVSIFSI